MKGIAVVGGPVKGGRHCHGHNHAPPETPGKLVSGSDKVFVNGKPVVRQGDRGYSSQCCGSIGEIEVTQDVSERVFVDGKPAAMEGSGTSHCGMGAGEIESGSPLVAIGGGGS